MSIRYSSTWDIRYPSRGGEMATYTYEAESDVRSQDNTARRVNKRTNGTSQTTRTRVQPCSVIDSVWTSDPALQRYSIIIEPPRAPTYLEAFDRLKIGAIDWDSGIDSVIAFKEQDFQILSSLLELREFRTFANTFISSATSLLGYFGQLMRNSYLTTTLVVVPTANDVRAFAESSRGTYRQVMDALRRIQTPTKFSTKQITKSVTWEGPMQPVYYADYGASGGFLVSARPQYRAVSKRRGSGRVTASPFVNTVLLSAMTSSYNFNYETVWNFIPFSFIVDYFMPVGDALAAKSSDFCTFAITDAVAVEEMWVQTRWSSMTAAPYGPRASQFVFEPSSTLANNRHVRYFNRSLESDTPLDGREIVIPSEPDLSVTQALNTFVIAATLFDGILSRR